MEYILGALAGLVWGAAAAYINMLITKKSLEKKDAKAALTANYLRLAVDAAALALIFLTRGILPFSYEACMVATAISLSVGTIIATLALSRKMK